MKPIVLEYQIAREQWVAGLMAVLSHWSANDPYRGRLMIARLIGLVMLVILWTLVGWDEWSLFAACVFLPIGELLIQRFIGRRAVGSTFDPDESSIWLEISEDGLHERTQNRERRYLWRGVRGIYETGGVIVFDLAGTDILVVPLNAISPEQRLQLEAGLAENEKTLVRQSSLDARAGTSLPEAAIIAKISVAVAIMGAAVGWATSGPMLMASGPDHIVRNLLVALGAGLLLAALGWMATGLLLELAARRREALANGLAWSFFAAAMVIFALGFLWR